MAPKRKYIVQTNRSGDESFRVPIDQDGSVRDAMHVISSRMSKVLNYEVHVTTLLVAKSILFEEDTFSDVVDEGEIVNAELMEVEAMAKVNNSTNEDVHVGNGKKRVLDRECSDYKSDDKCHSPPTCDSKRERVSPLRYSSLVADRKEGDSASDNKGNDSDSIFYDSFASALSDMLPSSPSESLVDLVALAARLSRTQFVDVARQEDKVHDSTGNGSWVYAPNMGLESYLSTWATQMLLLMKEARSCFDFHHLSHGDEALQQPTPVQIYEDWLVEVPSMRTDGSISLIKWFSELAALKSSEEESAAYIDAFAAALHVCPHNLVSLNALAKRVLVTRRTTTEISFVTKWAKNYLALLKVVFLSL